MTGRIYCLIPLPFVLSWVLLVFKVFANIRQTKELRFVSLVKCGVCSYSSCTAFAGVFNVE